MANPDPKPTVFSLVIFALSVSAFVGGFVLIQYHNDHSRLQTYEPFEGCGKVDNVWVMHNVGGYNAPESRPVITFHVDGRDCDYWSDEYTWQHTHVGERRRVQASRNEATCFIRQILGPC